jgi:hypothetical protein
MNIEDEIIQLKQSYKESQEFQRQIMHDLNGMRQELKNYEVLHKEERDRNDQLRASNERLVMLLEGDKADPQSGFLFRVRKMEEALESIKYTKAYFAGNLAATIFIFAVVSGIIAALWKLYTFFAVTKHG